MSRLVLFGLIAVAVWYVWRSYGRRAKTVTESLRKADDSLSRQEPVTLTKDPKTGVYRPADRTK